MASLGSRDRFYVCGILVMMGVFLASVPDMISSLTARQAIHPDAVRFGDMKYAMGLAVLLAFARRATESPFSVLGDMVVARKPDWTATYRRKKIKRFCEQSYKLMYAVCISVFEWHLLQAEPFFPRTLGGSGDISRVWWEREAVAPFGFRVIYWCSFAYNIEDFVSHTALTDRRSDYYEMIFHHVMALALIAISYFTNHWRAGLIVLFVHDVPDIFAHGIKCSVDGSNTPRTLSIYFGLLITWAYFRLYVFPTEVIYSAIYALEVEGVWAMLVMAFALLSLHSYWFYSFITMGLAFLKTGKTVDTQQLIIEKDGISSQTKSSPSTQNNHVKCR